MNDSPFLTVNDVAKELNLHIMTVYRLIRKKQIPGQKFGGRWRTNRVIFDQFVSEGHQK